VAMAPVKSIVVLGGGVTGLTVASELAYQNTHRVLLLEKAPQLGGLASTFQIDEHTFDTGSHRLHQEYVPAVTRLLEELCGNDLLRRERNGLIYIRGKPLPYPPTVFDILCSLSRSEQIRALADLLTARVSAMWSSGRNFEQYTVARVGYFLYEHFYRPYAAKLYALRPDQIAIEPALTRVRPFRVQAFARDLVRHLRKRRSHFRYPRHGIGQIARELNKRFLARGGEVVHIRSVKLCTSDGMRRISEIIFHDNDGQERTIPEDVLISTIPIRALFELLYPEMSAPDVRWRDLRIVYLVCTGQHNTPHETYYCPDPETLFGRVSDLQKYSPELSAS